MSRLGLGTHVSDAARDGDLYLKGSVRWTDEAEIHVGYAGGMNFQAITSSTNGAEVLWG